MAESTTKSTSVIQVVKDSRVEQFEKPMPTHYWLRNKKPSVNYIHDTPFATERQLEDQRLLMQRNRNPQLLVPTKVDKQRSQTISATLGSSRPEAVKANVLNKIVREASGVHNYTIVAPMRRTESKPTFQKLEPETNPKVRPYAREAKMKPILCSFGHRPRSASRTFHPATMKFRLKHGEIARGGDNASKTGFGLPVSVLAQVLKAPKLYHPNENAIFGDSSLDDQGGGDSGDENVNEDGDDHQDGELGGDHQHAAGGDNLNDLFFTESEHLKMFRPVNKDNAKEKHHTGSQKRHSTQANSTPHLHSTDDGSASLDKPSWISSVERRQQQGIGGTSAGLSPGGGGKLPPIVYPEPEQPYNDGRPAWDQAHHCVRRPNNYIFQMRSSGLNTDAQKLSLGDRLKRFSKLAVAEQPALFCTEKQAIDKQVMAGIEHKVPKPTPHHGQSAPYDPRDNEVTLIKHYRQQDLRERRQRREATEFQRLLKTIPKVDYFPTTRLAEMYAKAGVLDSQGSFTGGGGGDGDGSSLGVDSAAVAGMGVGQHSVSTPVEAGDVGGSTSNGVGVANASVGGRTAGGSVYSNILQSDLSWTTVEQEMREAMCAAKAGNTQALVDFNIRNAKRYLAPIDLGSGGGSGGDFEVLLS